MGNPSLLSKSISLGMESKFRGPLAPGYLTRAAIQLLSAVDAALIF
jgi:hypothetical protein